MDNFGERSHDDRPVLGVGDEYDKSWPMFSFINDECTEKQVINTPLEVEQTSSTSAQDLCAAEDEHQRSNLNKNGSALMVDAHRNTGIPNGNGVVEPDSSAMPLINKEARQYPFNAPFSELVQLYKTNPVSNPSTTHDDNLNICPSQILSPHQHANHCRPPFELPPPQIAQNTKKSQITTHRPLLPAISFQVEPKDPSSQLNCASPQGKRKISEVVEKSLSATQRKLSKYDVPKDHIHIIDIGYKSEPKKSRTTAQKQNKSAVEMRGGSCTLCMILKHKCDSDLPCESCGVFWAAWSAKSTTFRWTCTIKTSWIKDNILSSHLGNRTPQSKGTSVQKTISMVSEAFDVLHRQNFNDLLLLLEPFRVRNASRWNVDLISCISFGRSLLNLRQCLQRLKPEARQTFDRFAELQGRLSVQLLSVLEKWYTLPPNFAWFVLSGLMSLVEDIDMLRPSLSESEAKHADHLREAILNSLQVCCTRIYGVNKSQWSTSAPVMEKDLFGGWVESLGLSEYLAPFAGEENVGTDTLTSLNITVFEMWTGRWFEQLNSVVPDHNSNGKIAKQLRDPADLRCCDILASYILPGVLEFFEVTAESAAELIQCGTVLITELKRVVGRVCESPKKEHFTIFNWFFARFFKRALDRLAKKSSDKTNEMEENSLQCTEVRKALFKSILAFTIYAMQSFWFWVGGESPSNFLGHDIETLEHFVNVWQDALLIEILFHVLVEQILDSKIYTDVRRCAGESVSKQPSSLRFGYQHAAGTESVEQMYTLCLTGIRKICAASWFRAMHEAVLRSSAPRT